MRYVIKNRNSRYSFVESIYEAGLYIHGFEFTDTIEKAKQFNSLYEAIEAIVQRSLANRVWTNNFTIVGIKEVSTPRYEEVIL